MYNTSGNDACEEMERAAGQTPGQRSHAVLVQVACTAAACCGVASAAACCRAYVAIWPLRHLLAQRSRADAWFQGSPCAEGSAVLVQGYAQLRCQELGIARVNSEIALQLDMCRSVSLCIWSHSRTFTRFASPEELQELVAWSPGPNSCIFVATPC